MVIIEGTAFPLDKINKNGWGVPASEAGNAISSLKNSVIRVCPRDAPHGCDFSEDPKAEIGRILDVWKEGKDVKIRADITDSIASQKVEDGTWPNTWSVYGHSQKLTDGWVEGFAARSMTLVLDPAWEDAKWGIAASESGGYAVRTIQSFSLIASQAGDPVAEENNNQDPSGGDPSPEEKIEQLEQTVADRDKEIEDLKKNSSDLTAANEELGKKVKDLEKIVASHEKNKATSVPMEKVQELIETKANEIAASAIDKHKEDLRRSTAFEKLSAARKELDLETKADDYQHLTAADLEKLADEFGGVKVTAGTKFQYPASESGKSRTGVYNPVSGVFE